MWSHSPAFQVLQQPPSSEFFLIPFTTLCHTVVCSFHCIKPQAKAVRDKVLSALKPQYDLFVLYNPQGPFLFLGFALFCPQACLTFPTNKLHKSLSCPGFPPLPPIYHWASLCQQVNFSALEVLN